MDSFELHDKVCLIVIDYYSLRLISNCLVDFSSESVVHVLEDIFTTRGFPDAIISDNGPQFNPVTFHQFAMHYGFMHG